MISRDSLPVFGNTTYLVGTPVTIVVSVKHDQTAYNEPTLLNRCADFGGRMDCIHSIEMLIQQVFLAVIPIIEDSLYNDSKIALYPEHMD